MKNRLLPLFVVLGSISAYSQVGVGTLTPNKSAQLEVFSDDKEPKGMLIPRVKLRSTTDATTITNGNVNSLLVFATDAIGDIKPGYYCDNKGIFLRMFKRRFKNNFDFFEKPFLIEKESKDFNHIIYAIYDKQELLAFLKKENDVANALVCLFDKQLYKSLSFLESIDNLILFDESKTRLEISNELKFYFKNKSNFKVESKSFMPSNVLNTKFNDYYKAMYFLL